MAHQVEVPARNANWCVPVSRRTVRTADARTREHINETAHYRENHLSFGGGTDNGIGRVGSRHEIERLTELQTVVIG